MATNEEESVSLVQAFDKKSGFNLETGIYHSLVHLSEDDKIPTQPNLDTATYVLSQFPPLDQAESRVALIDFTTNERLTYAQLDRSIRTLAAGFYHGLGVRKGDVVFVLSPNSLLYPIICLAVLSDAAPMQFKPINRKEQEKQEEDAKEEEAVKKGEEEKEAGTKGKVGNGQSQF